MQYYTGVCFRPEEVLKDKNAAEDGNCGYIGRFAYFSDGHSKNGPYECIAIEGRSVVLKVTKDSYMFVRGKEDVENIQWLGGNNDIIQ